MADRKWADLIPVVPFGGLHGSGNDKTQFERIAELERDLAAAREWREAVLNELIVAHIYTKEHDTNPRKAIQDAITWNCQVALDPAVSSDAQKLIAAAQETRERAEERIAQLEACVKGENAQLRKKAGITVLIETAVNPKEGT